MKICNVCQYCYEDAAFVCPQDNSSLVETRQRSFEVEGNYRLERLLERDAAGETYQAWQINSDKSFVIRFFAANSADEMSVERASVLREMQAAVTIDHPSVNRVVDSGTLPNGEFYFVEQAISGQNLRDYLRSAGSLSEMSAITVARQAAEGLEAAHRAGVIHRGVSLANIILLDDGGNLPSIKLRNFDFGGFRQRAVVADATDDNLQIDVLRYLSPEQCAGQTVDERTDIYSLGVAFYEMLTGRSPFDKPTREAIVHKQINEQPLEQVHYEVKALIKHSLQLALQNNPALRTPSALKFARHLRHIEQVAAQTLAFQMPKQSSSENKSTFGKATVYVPPVVLLPSDSLVDMAQPPINSFAVENTVAEEIPVSLVALPSEEKIEKGAETEIAPVFQSEPIHVQKKSSEAIQINREPIRVKRKETEAISFVPTEIRIRKKENVGAPIVEELIAEETIFSTVPSDRSAYPPRVTPIPASFDADRLSRQHAPNRQSLFIGAGLVALLALAGLGAFIYDRQATPNTASQQQPPIVVAPAPPAPSAVETNSASDTSVAANDSETPDEDDSALAAIEEPPSLAPVNDEQTEPRDERIEPRQQSTTKNTSVNTPIDPDAPRQETAAVEKISPVPTEIVAGQNRPRVVSVDGISRAELNASLDKWITATNARDVEQQMSHYAPKVDAYYLSRNASQAAVRTDKKRVFERATSVDIKTGKPDIVISPDGRTAKMRFRKKYTIKEGQRSRNGEVIQELQWVKSGSGWRIVSERDVKVVNR